MTMPRRLAYSPEQVIHEMREVSRMDHPWIPGARAVLIRDASALLEQQAAEIVRLRAELIEARRPVRRTSANYMIQADAARRLSLPDDALPDADERARQRRGDDR